MVGVAELKAPGIRLLRMLALALVYYGAARLGLMLAFASTNVSPVWPPSGIALAAVLALGNRSWPGIFLGAFAANLAVFSANHVAAESTIGLMSASISVGNTMEALVGAYLVRRFIVSGRYFGKAANIYKFVAAAIFAAMVSAGVGTLTLVAGGIVPPAALWSISSLWWLGDACGMLALAPFLLTWGRSFNLRKSMREYGLIALSAALLAIALALIFGQQYASNLANRWVAYLLLPIIGWAAYRYLQHGVTAVMVAVTAAAVVASTHGLGPFATGTLQDSLMTLEIFIGLCCVVGLVLAADMSNRLRRDRTVSLPSQPGAFLNWPTLFLCLGLTIVAWHFISSNTQRQAEERFKFIADTVKQRIEERMNVYETLLFAGQGLFAASHDVERGEWKAFVEHLNVEQNFPGVLGIGYARRINESQREAVVRAAHADGLDGFAIWPLGARDDYVPVVYMEPYRGSNQLALGYDMFSEPARRDAMIRARDSAAAAITRQLVLVQNKSNDRQAGFLMYVPIYRNGAPIRNRAERIAALQGFVYCPFRIHDLMEGILGGSLPEVAVQIYDGLNENDAALMYSSSSLAAIGSVYPNALTSSKLISVVSDEKNWALRVTSLPPFEASIDRQKSLIVLIAGTMISLLFFGIVSNLAKTRETAEALAEQMVTALKESNLNLRKSEERFRLLTSKVKDYAILLLDPDGKILTWNEGAQRLNGYTEEEAIGRPFDIFYPPEDVEAGKAQIVLNEARKNGQYEASGWHVRKDGRRYYADILMTALRDERDALIGFAKITRDITQEKRVEQELHTAIEQAESASRAKSEFVANMSHELRTPMNAVLGVTYLLGSSGLTQEQRKYLDMIRTSGQSLLDILNDILDFSKIEAGRMELSPAEFRLCDLLDAIATVMSVNAGEKDLELAVVVGAGVPQALIGDELRVQQILLNLVSNAIKFTERGEISLSVELLEQHDDVATLQMKVRDTGIGVSPDQQARLFSPFTQADSSMTRRFGGSGLGLTICRRLVELMGGRIAMQSELGRGSEFFAIIPFKTAVFAEDPKRPKNALPSVSLLVADDSRLSRESYLQIAHCLGWHVELAATGADVMRALATAQRGGRTFDAVFLDWQLPDMNGITMLESIRAQIPDSSLPVVFTANAFGRSELMNLGAASKADLILAKPITSNTLYDTMVELLVHRTGAMNAAQNELANPRVEQQLAGVRILLAEDNVMNQIVAKGVLEQCGAIVDIAENGQMAVDILRAAPQAYDLVLMDVQMPVMDGFTATRLIRNSLGLTLPVLATTAGVTESERKQCVDAGMDDFIAKPIDLPQMIAVIRKHSPNLHQTTRVPNFPGEKRAPSAGAKNGDGREKTVLDMSQLVALGADSPAFAATIAGLVEGIVALGMTPMESARQSLEKGDSAACSKVLHRMRGEIGSLGAERLVEATMACELAIKHGQLDQVAGLLEQVGVELRLVLEYAQKWLDERRAALASGDASQESASSGQVPMDVITAALAEFRALLVEQNVAACDRYPILRAELARRLSADAFANLDIAIKGLDFARALAILKIV